MRLPSRATVVIDVTCVVALFWLYVGDVLKDRHALSAEAAAVTALPNMAFAVAALALTLGVAAVAAWGAWRSKPESFRGYRLPPIAFVLIVFVDLFVFSSATGATLPAPAQLAEAMETLTGRLQAQTNAHSVPTEPGALRALVAGLGQPPYLARGQRVPQYTLELRSGCEQPVLEAPVAPLGTIFYCVAAGGVEAWLTVVGLPAGEPFGEPRLFSVDGTVSWWHVGTAASKDGQAPLDAGG
jgi:hypothetical protein